MRNLSYLVMIMFPLCSSLKHTRLPFQRFVSSIASNMAKAPLSDITSGDSSVSEVFKRTIRFFETYNIEDADSSARYLISDCAKLGFKYSDFQANMRKKLSKEELEKLLSHCERRSRYEPVQYILGSWEFCGFEIKCQAPILIPRPETEELVELILSHSGVKEIKNPRILDVGCGSGAIGIALTKLIPNATCLAIDIDPQAVQLTEMNSKGILGQTNMHRHESRTISFANFVAGVTGQEFDLIVSNPPYIPSKEIPHLQSEVRLFESILALDGGADGLRVISDLLRLSPRLFKRGSRCAELWLETDPSHPPLIESLLATSSKVTCDGAVAIGSQQIDSIASDGVTSLESLRYWKSLRTFYDFGSLPRFVRLSHQQE